MNKDPDITPGTVSKILWHFTGGPTWNEKENRQNKRPKYSNDAYKNLKSILKTRELRIGNYKEIIRLVLPEIRKYSSKKKKILTTKNVPTILTSSPVCCLSDIPAAHLRYHAYRYGKFAVGFHRDAALAHGFNPVFYTLETTNVIRSIYQGFSNLDYVDPWYIVNVAQDIESHIEDNYGEDSDITSSLSEIEGEAEYMADTVNLSKESIEEFVAFIKTFNTNEFSSIYCEREWRALNSFSFDYDDIAMIVIPRKIGKTEYFNDFIRKSVRALRLPRQIPIIPWEDLVEH